MKIRSFLTALTRKITVLLIGAVIVGLAIYGAATKTIPGLGLFRDAPQIPHGGETEDGLSLNDADDSFELTLPPPGTPGTDFKSVPYPASTDETPAADPPPGTDLKSVPYPVSVDETEARQENCLHCNEDEQLIVDLNYYRQLLNILKQIDQDRKNIGPDMLDAAHRRIAQTRPRLARILATEETPNQVMPGEPAVEDQLIAALLEGDPQLLTELLKQEIAESGAQPDAMDQFLLRLLEHNPNLLVDALRETAPGSKTTESRPPQAEIPASIGIDGLYLAHVDNKPGKSGTARVILVSHEQPFTRTEGGIIRHNGKDYKIVKIDYSKDRHGNNQRQVTLQDMGNNETHVIPWQ